MSYTKVTLHITLERRDVFFLYCWVSFTAISAKKTFSGTLSVHNKRRQMVNVNAINNIAPHNGGLNWKYNAKVHQERLKEDSLATLSTHFVTWKSRQKGNVCSITLTTYRRSKLASGEATEDVTWAYLLRCTLCSAQLRELVVKWYLTQPLFVF